MAVHKGFQSSGKAEASTGEKAEAQAGWDEAEEAIEAKAAPLSRKEKRPTRPEGGDSSFKSRAISIHW